MLTKFSQIITNPLLIIFAAVLLRLVPHPPNFAPIAALALFGGAYLSKRWAIAVPLLAMLASDLFLGFHSTMPYVYGSFVLSGLLGLWLAKHRSIATVIGASLIGSVLFFLITNFGVWASTNLYPKTIEGLMLAYTMGIPFFRNTLAGDLFYVGVFFGGYEFLKIVARAMTLRVKGALI